jgi:hypothetical protein
MKLSQLYANTESFKSIVFNEGMNIILGRVTKKSDLTKDSHNLGKSTLIAVLDFMMLKNIDKSHFFKQFEDKFKNIVLYLEILLNNGQYLTIRRSISESTKISFKLTNKRSFLNEDSEWDHSNITLQKSIKLLNDYLEFDVLQDWDYRKSITYFLRSQKDYFDIFQLGKYQNGKHVDWKPFIFDLLGFEGKLLTEKYQIENQIESQNKIITGIRKEFSVDAAEFDKIQGSIDLKRIELNEMKQTIDNFNFYQQERAINKNLVNEIESTIAELNSTEYTLLYELDKAKTSIENVTSFDIEQLKEIYSDVQIYFPENIVHDFKELTNFNKDITEERNKYLREQIKKLSEKIQTTREHLQILNGRRDDALNVLQNKDTFKKFKTYQMKMAELEGDIARLEEQLRNIDKVSNLNEVIDELKEKAAQLSKQISAHIKQQDNAIYAEIKKVFNNVFRTVFDVPALLYVQPNAQGNIDFKSEVSDADENKITAQSNGNTYHKMLCVAFDLAVLIAYNKKSFYRFVYHDGVLEGLDNRKKHLFIELVRQYCQQYNLQYIFTTIEDDLPSDLFESFTEREKCLTLDDSGDSGKLFGFSF